MTAIDSLLRAIAHNDSLLAASLARDTVHVALPTVTMQAVRDSFDKFQLAASLLVAPAFALAAAWLGGLMATRAALTAHALAVKADQQARADERAANAKARAAERDEDRSARRDQMCTRIERTLRRVETLSEGLPAENDLLGLSVRGAELRILWESFERQSSDLHLVGAPEFQARIEAFIASLHTTVAGVEATLGAQSQMRQAEIAGAGRSGRGIGNILTQYDPAQVLDKFREAVIEKGKEANALLAELESVDANPTGGS